MTNPKYLHSEEVHRITDADEIVPYIMELFSPHSVVDVGCGLGSFLYSFKKYGVQHILGIEGNWVDKTKLHIREDEILIADLEKKLTINERFDVAVCMEVAEHLSLDSAPSLIELLVSMSDVIIFSAAIPKQGGQNHQNEQWASYWIELFSRHDFVFYDIFRPKFWNNENIFWWYRQNMFLVMKKGVKHSFIETPILNYVHPDLLFIKIQKIEEAAREVTKLRNGVRMLKATADNFELFRKGEFELRDYFSLLVRAIKNKIKSIFVDK